jgi:hypothetical protein
MGNNMNAETRSCDILILLLNPEILYGNTVKKKSATIVVVMCVQCKTTMAALINGQLIV